VCGQVLGSLVESPTLQYPTVVSEHAGRKQVHPAVPGVNKIHCNGHKVSGHFVPCPGEWAYLGAEP
jgi:hypothetical protein